MIFEKKSVRTLEVNRVASLILSIGMTSGGSKKKEKHTDFDVLFCGLVSTDLFFESLFGGNGELKWCFNVKGICCYKLFFIILLLIEFALRYILRTK
jgi:hypothetical protein